MTETKPIQSGKDTWVGSGAPAANHNDANRIKLRDGICEGYLYKKNPVPLGLVVPLATLTVYVAKAADWAGTKTISVRRTADRVPFGRETWNNKAGATGGTVSATVTDPSPHQAIVLDVTDHIQRAADGDPWYGWKVTTDSASAIRLYGHDSEYPPVLQVEYAISPSQPVDLVPSGGSVSVQFPVFQFDAVDLENPSDMTDLQIQFSAAADTGADGAFTTPTFDTGWVPSTVPDWESAGSAWAGVAVAEAPYWIARYRDGSVVGDWSDPVTFTRTDKDPVTITNPAAAPNNFVWEHTPPIIWSFPGVQKAWRVLVVKKNDHSDIVADSGRQGGADTSWTPPKKKLKTGHDYTVIVRVWDDVQRVKSPGDPLYSEATRDFTVNHDVGVTSPTLVSAAQDGGTPFVTLTWTIATAPDSWTVLRDGEVAESGIDPADVLTAGTTYVWNDPGASPQVPHTYTVRAVVNNHESADSNAIAATTYPEGVWLLDIDREFYVTLADLDVENWERTDNVAVYETVGGRRVQIIMGDNGISGSFRGTLMDCEGRTTAQWRADFDEMAARPRRTYQLVAANLSIPVKTRNMSATPHPETTPDELMDRASFAFFEDK